MCRYKVDIVDIKFHNDGKKPYEETAPFGKFLDEELVTCFRRAILQPSEGNEEEEEEQEEFEELYEMGFNLGMAVSVILDVEPYTEERTQKVRTLIDNIKQASTGPEKKAAAEVLKEEVLARTRIIFINLIPAIHILGTSNIAYLK